LSSDTAGELAVLARVAADQPIDAVSTALRFEQPDRVDVFL
jgi:hypothetical protein